MNVFTASGVGPLISSRISDAFAFTLPAIIVLALRSCRLLLFSPTSLQYSLQLGCFGCLLVCIKCSWVALRHLHHPIHPYKFCVCHVVVLKHLLTHMSTHSSIFKLFNILYALSFDFKIAFDKLFIK